MSFPSLNIIRRSVTPRRGFTLLEILVVVAIVGILAALLMPAISSARATAQSGACAANLRQIGTAMTAVATDGSGRLPGSGMWPGANSASWTDVISVLMGSTSAANAIVQRAGDKQKSGKIYCPSMRPWKEGPANRANTVRAYVANYYVFNAVGGNTNGEWNGLVQYGDGALLNAFRSPSRTVSVFESELSTDTYNCPLGGYGPITLGNGINAPTWASTDLNFAFRHQRQMHVLFIDGHVEARNVEGMQDLLQPKYFWPDSVMEKNKLPFF